MDFILKHRMTVLGVAVGAVAGYLYYLFVGCATGSCPITSQPANSTVYGAVLGGLVLNIFKQTDNQPMIQTIKNLLGFGPSINYRDLLAKAAQIIDVRSRSEDELGHIRHSLNIPLPLLSAQLSKINKDKPVITCCASGMRSASAKRFLKSNGYGQVFNGGGWTSLNQKLK